MIRVLVALTALLLAPVGASAATPPPAAASEAEINRLLSEIVAYSAPYQAAMSEAASLITLVIEGMDKAMTLSSAGADRATVDRDMDAWEAQLRATTASLQAHRDQLPAFPESTVERASRYAPSLKARVAGYREVRVNGLKEIAAAITFAQRMIAPTRKAAYGDAEAARDLSVEMVIGFKLILQAENAMLETGVSTGDPKHPQTALTRSVLAGNHGIELYFDYAIAVATGGPNDRAATAKAIRDRVAEVRLAAQDAVRLSAAMSAALEREPVPPNILGRMQKMLDSYRASSDVELTVAAALETVAGQIEQGRDTPESLQAAMTPADAAMDLRMKLQAERLALMKP